MARLKSTLSSNPGTETRVVVFHVDGYEWLSRLILHDIPHCVFDPRAPAIPLWRLIGPLVRRIRNLDLLSVVKGWGKPRLVYFQLKKIFLLACLEYLQPRIVITYVDNSGLWQVLSKEYESANFIAIQNGGRGPWCMTDALPAAPHPASKINIPIYYCFGQWESDLHKKYGHTIRKAIPVGSLVGGQYWFRERTTVAKLKFELCIGSQWHSHFFPIDPDSRGFLRDFGEGTNRLAEYIGRYASERNVDVAVAPRTNEPAERAFYERHLGKHLKYTVANKYNFGSYRTIDCTKLTVVMNSTLGYETFGAGKKVLFCNLSGNDQYTCPIPGPWSLGKVPYEVFRERLDELRGMNPAEFCGMSSATARYFMNYDPSQPASEIIRRDLKAMLAAA